MDIVWDIHRVQIFFYVNIIGISQSSFNFFIAKRDFMGAVYFEIIYGNVNKIARSFFKNGKFVIFKNKF